MNNNTLRIGTRKSRLAMVQTEIVREEILAHFPFLEVEIVPMSTKGDQILDRSLTSFGGKGVFTKELEEALLRGEIDLAVHCGFVINRDHATSADILSLCRQVQDQVKAQYGVDLELEVKLLGEF